MSVTRKDIARRTGLSPSTVGMILSGRGDRYNEDTRARVLQAAKDLDYTPNLAARSLKVNRSFLLGVLINVGNARIATQFLRGVQAALAEGDYSPVVFSHIDIAEQADCLRRCIDRRVDGLIANVSLDAEGDTDAARYETLLARRLPLVEVFGHFLPEARSVNIDNVAAGRDATRHLLDLGHRRIAMLSHGRYDVSRNERSGRHFDAWERYLGYEQAMKQAGLEPVIVTHSLSGEVDVTAEFFAGGSSALDDLLTHPARPTAVVCYNDYQAYGLIRAARLHGVVLPDSLSMVGQGDFDLSQIVTPTLTTLSVPAYDVGRQAAESVLKLINDKTVEDTLIESKLIVRESTCEPTH